MRLEELNFTCIQCGTTYDSDQLLMINGIACCPNSKCDKDIFIIKRKILDYPEGLQGKKEVK